MRRKSEPRRRECGITLVELLIVLAIVALLVAIAIPMYANIQARARISKAQADVRTLATAVTAYRGHMGVPPTALAPLTISVTNELGATGGPFMAGLPVPPEGWGTAYSYAADTADGTFTISAAGDGTTARVP